MRGLFRVRGGGRREARGVRGRRDAMTWAAGGAEGRRDAMTWATGGAEGRRDAMTWATGGAEAQVRFAAHRAAALPECT